MSVSDGSPMKHVWCLMRHIGLCWLVEACWSPMWHVCLQWVSNQACRSTMGLLSGMSVSYGSPVVILFLWTQNFLFYIKYAKSLFTRVQNKNIFVILFELWTWTPRWRKNARDLFSPKRLGGGKGHQPSVFCDILQTIYDYSTILQDILTFKLRWHEMCCLKKSKLI